MDFIMPDDREDFRTDFRSACFDLTNQQRARAITALAFLLRGGPVLFRVGDQQQDKRQVYLDPGEPGGTFILGEKVYGMPKPGQPTSEIVPMAFDINLYSFVRYVVFLMPEEDYLRMAAALALERNPETSPEKVDPDAMH